MNRQDASFAAAPLSSFRDHSNNGNTNEGLPMLRDSTAIQFIDLQTQIHRPNIFNDFRIEGPEHRSHPYVKDFALEDQLNQAKKSMAEFRINLNGPTSLPTKNGIPKRFRTTFSPSQLNRLENEFRCSMYIVGLKRMRLAEELKLEERQVKIWFQNRRMKYKREQQNSERRAAQFSQYYCY